MPEGKEGIKKEAPGTKLAEIEEKIKVLRRKRTQARSQGESAKYDREIAELEKQKEKKQVEKEEASKSQTDTKE